MTPLCDPAAVFVPKVRSTTGPLISKINTAQITVLLSFPQSPQRGTLSEAADTQSIVCVYFPVSSQNKLQFECWYIYFFNLATLGHHVTAVFVSANWYQQVLLLTLMKSPSPACIAWNPLITDKKQARVLQLRGAGSCLQPSPYQRQFFFFFLIRLKTQMMLTSKNMDL